MTAYGRSQFTASSGRYTIEIHSVNRRNLDIHIYVPKELLFLDMEIRKWLSKEIKRGGLVVRVNRDIDPQNLEQALPDKEILLLFKDKWQEIADFLHFDPKQEITLSFVIEQLSRQPFAGPVQEEEKVKKEIQKGFESAMQQFLEMKETEGEALLKDMKKRIKAIDKSVQKIQNNTKEPEERYRQRLLEKIKELKQVSKEDEERLQREIIFFAEKIDITEEITRIHSHLSQFEKFLRSKEKSVGKTLDFLLQELSRETNTINSKTPDVVISQEALAIKSELEKIREQVQNIE
ncbi:MAG: YicC family protein [Simkaniaceae bacterium]